KPSNLPQEERNGGGASGTHRSRFRVIAFSWVNKKRVEKLSLEVQISVVIFKVTKNLYTVATSSSYSRKHCFKSIRVVFRSSPVDLGEFVVNRNSPYRHPHD